MRGYIALDKERVSSITNIIAVTSGEDKKTRATIILKDGSCYYSKTSAKKIAARIRDEKEKGVGR